MSPTSYDRGYVAAARSAFADRVRAFDVLPEDTRGLADFEPVYFNTLVVALDNYFRHATDDQDGQEGNALHEIQDRSASIMNSDGPVTADRAITSIEFSRLSKAFFDELERRSG
jgi:hypothetical protein